MSPRWVNQTIIIRSTRLRAVLYGEHGGRVFSLCKSGRITWGELHVFHHCIIFWNKLRAKWSRKAGKQAEPWVRPWPGMGKCLVSGSDNDQGSWPSPINRNWSEARQEIQARFYWGPCCNNGEWEPTTCSPACSLPEGGVSWLLIWCEGRGVSRGCARGVS